MKDAAKKSVVKKYSDLKADLNYTPEQLEAALRADDKVDDADISEIVAAINGDGTLPKQPKGKYYVTQEFRDVTDFSWRHQVDEDVSSFDPARLKELTEQGLVKFFPDSE